MDYQNQILSVIEGLELENKLLPDRLPQPLKREMEGRFLSMSQQLKSVVLMMDATFSMEALKHYAKNERVNHG